MSTPITSNGTTIISTFRGISYVFGFSGDFGGGSLAVEWLDDDGDATAFDFSPVTSGTSITDEAPTTRVRLTLTGASSPDIEATISLAPAASAAGVSAVIKAALDAANPNYSRTPSDAMRDITLRSIPNLIAFWDFSQANTMLNASNTVAIPGERVATIKDAFGGSYELTQSTDASRGVAKIGYLSPSTTMGYAVNSVPFNLRETTMIFFTAPRDLVNPGAPATAWWDQNPTTEGGMGLREYGGYLRNPTNFGMIGYEQGWGMLGIAFRSDKTVAFNKAKSQDLGVRDAGSGTILNLLMTESGTLSNVPMLGMMIFDRGLTDAEIAEIRAAFPTQHTKSLLVWGDSIAKSSALTSPYSGWAWRLANEDGYNFYDGGSHGSSLASLAALSGANQLSQSADDVFVLLAGTNDLAGAPTVATTQTEATSTMTASLFRRVVCTVLPRTAGFSGGTDAASFEVKRLEYNTWLRTQTFYEALVDFDTVPDLTDSTDTTYFSDGIHPTKAGADLILAKIRAVIATL